MSPEVQVVTCAAIACVGVCVFYVICEWNIRRTEDRDALAVAVGVLDPEPESDPIRAEAVEFAVSVMADIEDLPEVSDR